jgi:hypothetical protein
MPSVLRALFLAREVDDTIFVDLLRLLRANDTDLVILATETATRIADGMDV